MSPTAERSLNTRDTVLSTGRCTSYGVDWYCNGYDNAASPIVLSTRRGNGDYRFTLAAKGVQFDIDGDGDLDQVAMSQHLSLAPFAIVQLRSAGCELLRKPLPRVWQRRLSP